MFASPSKVYFPNSYVEGRNIRHVEEFKYLGVILDSTLIFNTYQKYLPSNIENFRHFRNTLRQEKEKTLLKVRLLYKEAPKVMDRKSRE